MSLDPKCLKHVSSVPKKFKLSCWSLKHAKMNFLENFIIKILVLLFNNELDCVIQAEVV